MSSAGNSFETTGGRSEKPDERVEIVVVHELGFDVMEASLETSVDGTGLEICGDCFAVLAAFGSKAGCLAGGGDLLSFRLSFDIFDMNPSIVWESKGTH